MQNAMNKINKIKLEDHSEPDMASSWIFVDKDTCTVDKENNSSCENYTSEPIEVLPNSSQSDDEENETDSDEYSVISADTDEDVRRLRENRRIAHEVAFGWTVATVAISILVITFVSYKEELTRDFENDLKIFENSLGREHDNKVIENYLREAATNILKNNRGQANGRSSPLRKQNYIKKPQNKKGKTFGDDKVRDAIENVFGDIKDIQMRLPFGRFFNYKISLNVTHESGYNASEFKKHEERFKHKLKEPVIKEGVDTEVENVKRLLLNAEKDLKGLKQLLKIKNKQLKFLETKVLKVLNNIRNSKEFDDKNDMTKEPPSKDVVENESGDWYSKMHKGRGLLRNLNQASNWMYTHVQKKKESMKK